MRGAGSQPPVAWIVWHSEQAAGGDFFAACFPNVPAWPVTMSIQAPTGERFTTELYKVGDTVDLFRFQVTPVVGRSDGVDHHAGMTHPAPWTETPFLEVMFWLPHSRPAGVWRAETAWAAAELAIPAPCAAPTTAYGGPNPFLYGTIAAFGRKTYSKGDGEAPLC